MKRLSYRVDDDEEKVLVIEQIADEEGKVLYTKDYQSHPIIEKEFVYNQAGQVIRKTEKEAGIEINRQEFIYDE